MRLIVFLLKDGLWNLINVDGCSQIVDPSLKMYFIEVEFPVQICPQLISLYNGLNTDYIKTVSVKNKDNNEFVIVWDKSNAGDTIIKNIAQLNLVTFTTNHVRFSLENNDISVFLPPFSIEIQGLYTDERNLYLSTLLHEENYKDVEFEVENKSIRAHRCIIAMRCPNLNQMNEPRIVIENFKYDTFKVFINYLYTNTLNTARLTPKLICELILLSDEYNLLELKVVCVNSFCNYCSDPCRIMDLYQLAVSYNIDELIDFCLQLISTNFELLLSMRIDSSSTVL